jgi:hypothetical protein
MAALALALHGVAQAGPARSNGLAIAPTLLEIGRGQDGVITTVAHGYAAANASAAALAATAGGDLAFRVGGLCLEGSEAGLVPTGVGGNTTAWSYSVSAVSVTLSEDAPKGSCKYSVRVSYAISLTGAVTISQMEYTVYLRGRAAAGAVGGGLAIIP